MFDSKTSGYQFSNLSDEDLKIITDAEQQLSRQHNTNQVLIAYDQTGSSPGQTGSRS